MREIKYRQKLKPNVAKFYGDKFHYWGYVEKECEAAFISPLGKNDVIGESQQYTGLKDKNGKEIYEGDVVRFVFEDGAIVQHKIEWSDKYHAWQVVNLSSGDSLTWNGSPLLWVAMKTYQPEVIGNIHQHTELLES